jgi:hypothetical protein
MLSEAPFGHTSATRLASGPRLTSGRVFRLLRYLLVLLSVTSARAQAATPFVVDEWRFGLHETNATLRYCIDARDPDAPVARKIAAAVTAALLLRPEAYVIGSDPRVEDMSGEDLDDTYRMLIQHCDVFFGFKLVPNAYPEWLTVTRPYYRSTYVFVAASPAWKSLSDMPTNRAIGATIGPGLGAGTLGSAENRPRDCGLAGDGTRPVACFDRRCRRHPAQQTGVPAQQHRSGNRLADR